MIVRAVECVAPMTAILMSVAEAVKVAISSSACAGHFILTAPTLIRVFQDSFLKMNLEIKHFHILLSEDVRSQTSKFGPK